MVPRLLPLRLGAALESAGLCSRCLVRIHRQKQPILTSRRTFAATRSLQNEISRSQPFPRILRKAYFSANSLPTTQPLANKLFRVAGREIQSTANSAPRFTSAAPIIDQQSSAEIPETVQESTELPHRRRQRLKVEKESNSGEGTLRPDASARLSALSSSLPKTSLRRTMATYLALTKPHLSFLVVLTATTAFGLYPIPSLLALDPAVTPLPTLSTSTLTCFYLTTGTFLASASANTLNMLFEPQHDARMSRTRNRPLVRKLLTPRAALLFAIATGTIGVGALYYGTNPTVAALGAFNLALYAFVYTPLKRIHVINTWVGAIVGGIPPLMGWVAAAGQTATTGHDTWRDMLFGPESAGGWILAAILYAWQFPHFNALSHTIREEYKNAGYRMLAWTNPARNGRVAMRYTLLLFPLCAGLWWVGVVDKGFLIGGTLVNCWIAREGYKFWRLKGANGSSRALFWASVWYLPLLLVGSLATKKGVWDGVWNRVMGIQPDDDDEFEDEEEEEEMQGTLSVLRTQDGRADIITSAKPVS
ncbi:protoheme IX farnesyltransferase [Polytolypa hystricis UAMH7299]|uniref:Protoheme IX farnesyltransferase, mitochondrial n=1 Tax=Polytolypa hystricis (strain UAMH7299) TaxID=1447883 RepID=A0A2B7XRV9_POLH7|nr:protoheme IX farnesyltransferase [Polytolypa hystricis UAMH7299]